MTLQSEAETLKAYFDEWAQYRARVLTPALMQPDITARDGHADKLAELAALVARLAERAGES